jgi:probable phosphomutase (TIGR03848 family)
LARFLLIRHGDNDSLGKYLAGRKPGVHLNESGMQQAQNLAERLARYPIKAVISSPLERAQETAAPIAQSFGLPIEILPDINEVDFGEWEGKDVEVLRKEPLWEDVQNRPGQVRFPGGETLQEAQSRIVEALVALNKRFANNDWIVCVSHCDVVRLAVSYFLDIPLDNFQRLVISPASISILSFNDQKPRFETINYTIDFPKHRE